jgi:DNA polymerase
MKAREGYDLVAADFSAIEGRGIAWLAGEESELDNYRAGKDPYIANAARILGKDYADITPAERQSPGKISVLACGYQGGVRAVRKFGGEGMTDEEISEQIVEPWRAAHPATVQYWRSLEDACVSAVREPGKIFSARGTAFRVAQQPGGSRPFLLCRLPSGRLLFYYDPVIHQDELFLVEVRVGKAEWMRRADPRFNPTKCVAGKRKIAEKVTYMTVDSITKKWVRTSTYGGKLAENVTQAICRDLMAGAMLRLEAAGYLIVLTVHDEIVSEVPEGFGSVEEFESIMCQVPEWAAGFPITAAGWRGKRYKKQ